MVPRDLKKNLACAFAESSQHTLHEAVPDLLRRCHPGAERGKRVCADHSARQLSIQPAAACTAAAAEDRGPGHPEDGRTAEALLCADRAAKIVWRARQQMPR